MSHTLEIWGRADSSNVQKVLWTAREIGLPFRRIDAGGPFGGLDDPGYRALNPHGRIPTLVDGEVVIWESNTIVRYLARRYGDGTLLPRDPGACARVEMWMDWNNASLWPAVRVIFLQMRRTPAAERDPQLTARARGEAAEHLEILAATLARSDYVAGATLTVADVPLGITLSRWLDLAGPDATPAAVKAWWQRLVRREAFRASVDIPWEG